MARFFLSTVLLALVVVSGDGRSLRGCGELEPTPTPSTSVHSSHPETPAPTQPVVTPQAMPSSPSPSVTPSPPVSPTSSSSSPSVSPTPSESSTAAPPSPSVASSPSLTPSSPAATSSPPTPSIPMHGSDGLGMCYEPMHSALYPLNGGDGSRLGEILDRDLQQLSQHFSVLRTYHSQHYGVRVPDYAAKYNLKLYVGLAKYPQNQEWEKQELEAAVLGAKENPGTVEAIIVGSEDLVQAGGDQTVDAVISKVQAVKQRLASEGVTGVFVGTSQRMNEFVDEQIASDMSRLVAACDFVGVNIYPFFSNGFDPSNPTTLLDAQWQQLRARYPSQMSKMRVTETGWPSSGSAPAGFADNAPSGSTQKGYFHAVANWKPQDKAGPHFWFMAYDRRSDDPSLTSATDFEQSFGVYTCDNKDKGVL